MKTTNNDWSYIAPKIEVLTISVELGFSNSIEDPIENPDQDW